MSPTSDSLTQYAGGISAAQGERDEESFGAAGEEAVEEIGLETGLIFWGQVGAAVDAAEVADGDREEPREFLFECFAGVCRLQ